MNECMNRANWSNWRVRPVWTAWWAGSKWTGWTSRWPRSCRTTRSVCTLYCFAFRLWTW